MHTKIAEFETRLNALEDAMQDLTATIATALPATSPNTQSIIDQINQAKTDFEIHKATSMAAARSDIFQGQNRISYQDLAFLCKQYVEVLAESELCDRVTKRNLGAMNKSTYTVDLSNLSVAPYGEMSVYSGPNSLGLRLTVSFDSHSPAVTIHAIELVDMHSETVDYCVPYTPEYVPIIKDRIIVWFYEQLHRAQLSDHWALPGMVAPRQSTDSHIITNNNKFRPDEALVGEITLLADELHKHVTNEDPEAEGCDFIIAKTDTKNGHDRIMIGLDFPVDDNDNFHVRLGIDYGLPHGLVRRHTVSLTGDASNLFAAEGYRNFKDAVDRMSLSRIRDLHQILTSIRTPLPLVMRDSHDIDSVGKYDTALNVRIDGVWHPNQ